MINAPTSQGFCTLTLGDFRCHGKLMWQFPLQASDISQMMAVIGPNGVGKTSVLEAFSLFSPGRGLRSCPLPSFKKHNSPQGWRIALAIQDPKRGDLLLETFMNGPVRKLRVNGVFVTQSDIHQWIQILWPLSPLSYGSNQKRAYFNRLVHAQNSAYAKWITRYEEALKERNRLLHQDSANGIWYDSLEKTLSETGVLIYKARCQALHALHGEMERHVTPLASPRITLSGATETAMSSIFNPNHIPEHNTPKTLGGEGASLQEAVKLYQLMLEKERPMERLLRQTRFGIHRTSISIEYKKNDGSMQDISLCSMGEQRALLLSVMLGAVRLLRHGDRQTPLIVLLDEVMTHLDEKNQRWLWKELKALGLMVWVSALDDAHIPPDVRRFSLEGEAEVP